MSARYVCFTVGNGRYGLPIEQVVQIIRHENITEVPTAPPYVEGVLNLRGEVIPVINIRERFGLPRTDKDLKNRVIVIGDGQRSYGLLVDGVREITELEEDSIEANATSVFGMRADFVVGIAKAQDDLLVILDIFKILNSPSLISLMD